MKWIEALGAQLDARWRATDYAEEAFSELAANALAATDCPADFFREVTAWGLGDHALPHQVDIEAAFGQPPICVYVNPLQTFYIQALIWLDSTTSVHQHGFAGAFKVVEGESLHARYAFDARDVVNARMIFGDLRYLDAEVLSVGDVRPIERGPALIHAVFHLDRPSVTLVARTFGDTAKGPQYDYVRPWLAVDPFYKSPRLQRNLQILTALREVDRARYLDTLRCAIPTTDLYTTYRYLRHYSESAGDSAERASLAGVIHATHRARGERLVACLDQLSHDGFLIDKRKQLRDRDHRFFVALLLNVPDRDTILRLIGSRYAGDPVEHIVRWIGELCDGSGAPLLPLPAATLRTLQSMARGATLEQVVRDLHAHYDEATVRTQRGGIATLYEMLRTSHFRPVLPARGPTTRLIPHSTTQGWQSTDT